jgi:hypothetical protein
MQQSLRMHASAYEKLVGDIGQEEVLVELGTLVRRRCWWKPWPRRRLGLTFSSEP